MSGLARASTWPSAHRCAPHEGWATACTRPIRLWSWRAGVDVADRPLAFEHGTQLTTTLRTYVQADYNANETARRLYVRANTLACRLRTIRRLLGGEPARGDLRLTIELALELKDLPRLSAAEAAHPPVS